MTKQTYASFFGVQVKALDFEEASQKILRILLGKYSQVHRFYVKDQHTKKSYLVKPDQTPLQIKATPTHAYDLYSTKDLERLCLTVGINPKTIEATGKVYTYEQTLLSLLDLRQEALKTWKSLTIPIIIGDKDPYDFYVLVASGGEITLGQHSTKEEIKFQGSIFDLMKNNKKRLSYFEESRDSIEISLLKKKLAVVEESFMESEVENERLRKNQKQEA